MDPRPTRTAVVLSGGGSRGAYEAGILLYIRTGLAKRLGYQPKIDIITGTSVGAINAAFFASLASDPVHQAQRLCDSWRSLRIEMMISLEARDLLRGVRLLLGGKPKPPAPGSFRYGGILQTAGLERFVVRAIPWRGIRRSLRRGHLDALAVSATHVGSGHTVVFIDTEREIPGAWSRDPFIRRQAARIGPMHVLASAAIPLFFPAVKIGDRFFTDGGLRQNTPMSPAIRLGADRMLVVSLRHLRTEREEQAKLVHEREEAYPKPLFLFGKALNALMLDHTEYDLDRMTRLNAILEAGTSAFGGKFQSVMNQELVRLRGAPLRRLEAVHVRPSEDIGEIASDFVTGGRVKLVGRVARRLIQRLARGESQHENDLLSYLMFDGNFASELIDLGYRDAERSEDRLARLFRRDDAA